MQNMSNSATTQVSLSFNKMYRYRSVLLNNSKLTRSIFGVVNLKKKFKKEKKKINKI